MVIVSFFAFLAFQIIPGDPISVMMKEKANPDVIANLTERMHLNDPWYIRFVRYIWDALHGDFGISYKMKNREVKDMIMDALRLLQRKISREPVGFNLLPPLFTLTQLQSLHEAILGEKMDKRNFRKRVGEMNFIEKTDMVDKTSSRKGAFLYRFNSCEYKKNPEFKL